MESEAIAQKRKSSAPESDAKRLDRKAVFTEYVNKRCLKYLLSLNKSEFKALFSHFMAQILEKKPAKPQEFAQKYFTDKNLRESVMGPDN